MDSLILEPISQPTANTPNMLSNEERVLCNIPPLQRLYTIDEDTYEELVCVWAFSCLNNKEYTEVYRVGQAGDKGRDILAYYDRAKGKYDLYQCKHYQSALTYSDLCGEMGKLIIYTFNNTYPLPQGYFILCPNDVSQSFIDLLNNKGKELKIKLRNYILFTPKKRFSFELSKSWYILRQVIRRQCYMQLRLQKLMTRAIAMSTL